MKSENSFKDWIAALSTVLGFFMALVSSIVYVQKWDHLQTKSVWLVLPDTKVLKKNKEGTAWSPSV